MIHYHKLLIPLDSTAPDEYVRKRQKNWQLHERRLAAYAQRKG